MQTVPSFKEDHISQIPALQFLVNMGYQYPSPDEALAERGGKTSNVLLSSVLKSQLEKLNSITYKAEQHNYTSQNIDAAIRVITEYPLQEGLITANEYIYDKLVLGHSLEQSIERDKKSYTVQYIDWDDWENNVFHVTEEYSALRANSRGTIDRT